MIEIKIPDIQIQNKFVNEMKTLEKIKAICDELEPIILYLPELKGMLENRMKAIKKIKDICDNLTDAEPKESYLKDWASGEYETPTPEVLQEYFKPYSKTQLGRMLGTDRDKIREWKYGYAKIPYCVWRHFLNLTCQVVDVPEKAKNKI